MKLTDLHKRFHLEKIKLSTRGIDVELSFQAEDQDAAWELYVEMLTRIVTQPLPTEAGDEKTALASVYSLFPTTKWHREALSGDFEVEAKRTEFRRDLAVLQVDLRNYNRMLAEIAGVEDLTDLELTGGE